MLRRIIIPILLLFLVSKVQAQELSVKSFCALPDDKTAQSQPVMDNEGLKCALIIIEANRLKGINFPREDHFKAFYDEATGRYLVYVSIGFPRLKFEHADYHSPDPINLESLNQGEELKAGHSYLLTLNVPVATGNTFIVLKVQPATAQVTFNNQKLPPSPNGIYEMPVQADTYRYTVEAENFVTARGSVTVEKGEKKTVTKRLQPIMHTIQVNCNAKNAKVYVDNTLYGTTGLIRLPQGRHTIRIQQEGYEDAVAQVDITASTGQLSYKLKKKQIEVHATPVTIFSNSSKIYKNYKLIKEWTNGATIKFMPGKYLLTDEYDNEKEIEVGDKPMVVRF